MYKYNFGAAKPPTCRGNVNSQITWEKKNNLVHRNVTAIRRHNHMTRFWYCVIIRRLEVRGITSDPSMRSHHDRFIQ